MKTVIRVRGYSYRGFRRMVIAMNGLMSETAILTLTLLVSAAMVVGAIYVIVMGGRLGRSRDGAKRTRQQTEPERRKAA